MVMRSLMGLLVGVMLAMGGTAGQGDSDGGKLLSLRATQFGGLGGFIEHAIHEALFHSRDGVERFATLPKPGPGFPEGITADKDGNIYVSTFDATGNVIHVFDRRGRLQTTTPVPGAPIGMAIGPDGISTSPTSGWVACIGSPCHLSRMAQWTPLHSWT